MRKLIGILNAVALLSSCGGGSGIGIDYEGYYYLESEINPSTNEVEVVDFVRDGDGKIRSYTIPSYDDFINVYLNLNYEGEFTGEFEKKRAFLKEIDVVYGSGENSLKRVYTYSREIKPEGLTVKIPLTSKELISVPFIYANALEDKVLTYTFENEFPKESFWELKEKEKTYSGKTLSFELPSDYRDLKVEVEDTICKVNSDGTLSSPCEGSLENGVLEITGIDSSYVKTSHQSEFVYYGPSKRSYVLSEGILKGSVKLELEEDNTGYHLALVDKDGELVDDKGNSYGTVDYDSGVVSLEVKDVPVMKVVNDAGEWVGFQDNGTLSLGAKIKPMTLKLEVYNGAPDAENLNSLGFCSDDGSGNLIGDCSGTVNYETGEVNYDWNLSTDGKSVYVSYKYYEEESYPVSVSAEWDTSDGNANVKVSYRELKSDAPTIVKIGIPPTSIFSGCKVYESGNGDYILGTDYTTEIKGENLYLELVRIPDNTLHIYCDFDKEFNFNKDVEVVNPERQEISVKVKVKAVLDTREKLEAEREFTITATSPEYF